MLVLKNRIKVRFLNSVTLKMGIYLDFLLQLHNHKPQQSDSDIVCNANNGTQRSHYHRVKFFVKKKELRF